MRVEMKLKSFFPLLNFDFGARLAGNAVHYLVSYLYLRR